MKKSTFEQILNLNKLFIIFVLKKLTAEFLQDIQILLFI